MPRTARTAPGGIIYHVLNRGVGKIALFRTSRDYEAFQKCLARTIEAEKMRLLAYCIMPTHWHLVLWPEHDGDLARFMLRLTISHVRRWLIHRGRVGSGHIYQGRYKSFAVQDDGHLSTVCRYVERNPVRAGLSVGSADWPWSSAGQAALAEKFRAPLAPLPIARRTDWRTWVDAAQTHAEETALLECIQRGRPYGQGSWLKKHSERLSWQEPRTPGRPRKVKV